MLNTLTPSKLKNALYTILRARLVPFIQSSPGIGKSTIIKQVAKELGLKVIDVRLSTMEPTDIVGLPWINKGVAQFNPYNFFPIDSTPVPEGYDGFLLFFDEFNSASRATQAAAYRVILDREIGQYKLHPRCLIAAAGNLSTDNAITNKLSTAMVSRIIHLELEANFEDWLNNVAIPNKYTESIIAFLSAFQDKLMDFDPERDEHSYCCPRSWEFVNKILKVNNSVSDVLPIISGCITEEVAIEFAEFVKVYKDLITIDTLKANPDCNVPDSTALKWATIIHLTCNFTEENKNLILSFFSKFPIEYRVLAIRSLINSNKDYLKDEAFRGYLVDIAKYIYD